MFVHRAPAVNPSGDTASSRSAHEHRSWGAWLIGLGWRRIAREVLLVAAIVVLSTLVLRGQAISQPFSVDESRWIAASRYFWYTFVDRDLFGPPWQPNYIVYTRPPVARYVIGFGLWLQGWSPDRLNKRYDSLETRLWNEREGNVPGDDLLQAARRVTLVFAVTSVVLLYGIGRQLGGRAASGRGLPGSGSAPSARSPRRPGRSRSRRTWCW